MANKGFFEEFFDSVDEGYKAEDEAARKDTAPLNEKIVHGFVEGATDAANPIKWVLSMFSSK